VRRLLDRRFLSDRILPRGLAAINPSTWSIGSASVPPGCFVSTGRSLDQALARVKLAESLGYHSAFVTHIAGRESLTVVTAYAMATDRIRVGTGVVPI
jgi:alkanesulfonate monooxygenase SsuD/methylene tetrahydromethanopterin reductase-like flavin-dependent oxidoreductase (luciferase family)